MAQKLEDSAKARKPVRAANVSNAVKGYIQNLSLVDQLGDADRATFTFFFRPEQVSQVLSVAYKKTAVLGMSHGYHGYESTDNERWSFELFANALLLVNTTTHQNSRQAANIVADSKKKPLRQASKVSQAAKYMEDGRRFLQALCYPATNQKGVVGGEPPAAILCIPHVLTQRVRLMSLSFDHTFFAETGEIMEWRCQTQWEEAPLDRILMQDVLDNGSFRTWG